MEKAHAIQHLIKEGNLTDAKSMVERELLSSSDEEILFLAGQVDTLLGDHEQARISFELFANRNAERSNRVAQYLLVSKLAAPAKKFLETVHRTVVFDGGLHRKMALSCLNVGDFQKAGLHVLEKAKVSGLLAEDKYMVMKVMESLQSDSSLSEMLDMLRQHPQVKSLITAPKEYEVFESLGTDCEFGIVQAQLGMEPLSLFRWGGMPTETLVRLLESDFLDFAKIGNSYLTKVDGDWRGEIFDFNDRAWDFHVHTFISTVNADPKDVLKKFSARLQFLTRKFREDLKEGAKIYIYKSGGRLSDTLALRLAEVLKTFGGSRLVIVDQGGERLGVNKVVRIGSNVVRGSVHKFNVTSPDVEDWEKMLDGVLKEFGLKSA
jgi:hypothetical protein